MICCIGFWVRSQENIQYRDHLPYPKILSDVWGYSAPDSSEYALVGVLDGVSIVDVSDPENIEEKFFLPGPESFWRDLKTFRNFAYVINEDSLGLRIIDLGQLPSAVSDKRWFGDTLGLKTCHNIYIDENGIAALFGCNVASGGALLLDLNPDPRNPRIIGFYEDAYCHDGFIRGDTLWTAELYKGEFGVIDIGYPANPKILTKNRTPRLFAHNVWLSDDGNTLFTTDEKPGAVVASFDVEDLSNISRLDTYKTPRGDSVIPHNVHVSGDFLVTSYYHDGLTIVDASRPDNLIETGYYDTSPLPATEGFGGAWGAFPYLNSGNILVTDRQEGLFVLTPDYIKGCYLEGRLRNAHDFFPIPNARIEIIGKNIESRSDITGEFKTGIGQPGNYDLRITAPGCKTLIVPDVPFGRDSVTEIKLDVDCNLTDIEEPEEAIQIQIHQGFGKSQIVFQLPEGSRLGRISLLNLEGRVLVDKRLSSTSGQLNLGSELPSGLYIIAIETDHYSARRSFLHLP